MFNNRMLAVAAVLVMAVPALGAATPIVVPPVPEQLVEGHTVFTVIEIYRANQNNTTTAEVRFAAAVAVLVREINDVARRRAEYSRFPGVLWFNDQYLVNPENAAVNDNEIDNSFRYPCGGAVMAVNAGDPDPRILIARADTPAGTVHVGDANHTYPASEYWVKPTPGTYYYGQDSGGAGDPATDYAWIGVKPDGSVYSDTVLTNGVDYEESYLITDPNDHSWIIDKYNGYTRTSGADPVAFVTDPAESNIYNFPVWVVNILGAPVFTTDQEDAQGPERTVGFGNQAGANCLPFLDIVPEEVDELTCGLTVPVANANVPQNFGHGRPFVDDPCQGYMEPSAGPGGPYCYGGQPAADDDGDGDVDKDDCVFARAGGDRAAKPFRYYNAVLYFKLEDLTVNGADKINHHLSSDTNGCSEEQYWWGPNPPVAATQYPCPADDDNQEGNSHPFHPATPTHTDEEPCPPGFSGPNPTNHGGSTQITGLTADADGYYQVAADCDWSHATRNIDIYFSGGGRPFPPVQPVFDVLDLEGSSAPFNGDDGSPAGH